MLKPQCLSILIWSVCCLSSAFGDGNRLAYLSDPCNPFYVTRHFPKLITPQWISDKGVEAVIVLSIDDMREPEAYELFMRPIINRLKQIDGRGPISILTNTVHADHPRLQTWMQEGLSLEVHTVDHPCPCLRDANFDRARSTYDRCVDLMSSVPGSRPVAFRMPCCDSINSTSPRFWTEIFNQKTAEGNFLQIDSSVFHVFSANDPSLPPEYTTRPDGNPRFRHYLPFPSYVNTIENYPYPYVIDRLCWEVPCLVPSDWEGQNVQQANNPQTLADMKIAMDATFLKQGATSLVFHPHGWITNQQLVEFVDYADKSYGGAIKFLNFAEYHQQLTENLLAGQPLRSAQGQDNGVRLIDLNHDGFLDVVIGNSALQLTRLWDPATLSWKESTMPVPIVESDSAGNQHPTGVQFFITQKNQHASMLVRNERVSGVWHFQEGQWIKDPTMLNGLELNGQPILTVKNNQDQGVRLRDLNGDGQCELVTGNQNGPVYEWDRGNEEWRMLPFGLPAATRIVSDEGADAGFRFVDIDEDGRLDVLFSNDKDYSLNLFESMRTGWSRLAQRGKRPEQTGIPPVVSHGTNQGAWFSQRHMWVQNEGTSALPDLVDRRSFEDLLGKVALEPRSPQASLAAIEVPSEYQVELVVAEPLVQDPVAFDWGPDGRLWVVEMADYPLGLDDRGKPGGRIRVLADTTGDGNYDDSTLFADGLSFPTDVMVWREGILVTAAPNVWYLKDMDQDGLCDHREILFTGFGEGNQQHRVNGLRWGLDNWVHLANGDSGGQIRSVKTEQTIDINGRDLKIRPDSGTLLATTGQTQHGRCRDDWGNWWGSNNSNPMMQFILEARYFNRNPYVRPPSLSLNHRDGQWGLFPISRIVSHYSGYQPPSSGQPSQFTSACGTEVYRDVLLGEKTSGNLFVSEPVHNLIHRRAINEDGLRRVPTKPTEEQGSEFLRSRDSWFRPTTIRTGPDGCLWVADMYRLVIEHPEWIDDQTEQTLDLRAGHERGRIYRIVPKNKPPRNAPILVDKNAERLIEALADENGTIRDQAHRLLLWTSDSDADRLLASTYSTSQHPLQRLTSLCILSGRGSLTPSVMLKALRDEHPSLRRHAIRLTEQWTDAKTGPKANTPFVPQLLSALADVYERETDPQVILQLACSLGEFDHFLAEKLLAEILLDHHDNPYLTAATLSSLGRRTHDFIANVFHPQADAHLTLSLIHI